MKTPDPETLYTISANGFSATVDAFALEPNVDDLYFISMIGSQVALKAISAALLKQPPDLAHLSPGIDGIPLGTLSHRCQVPKDTIGTWTIKNARLPTSGAHHNLTYTKTAELNYPKNNFLLLAREIDEAPIIHHRFLDKRSALPLHHSWAPWLWERGIKAGEIVPLKSEGIHAWRCLPNTEDLKRDLSNAVEWKVLEIEDDKDN